MRCQSEKYAIQALMQTGPEYHAIPTPFFAEILNLSVDAPTNLHLFNTNKAMQTLLATHLIKSGSLKKIAPHTLMIEYSCRKAVAICGNYERTYVDLEGIFFPHFPFQSAQNLPTIWLEETAASSWGERMDEGAMLHMNKILSLFPSETIEAIDLTRIHSPSAGRREIIIKLKNSRLIRLTPKNYVQELDNYFILEKELVRHGLSPTQIDLRTKGVAYLSE